MSRQKSLNLQQTLVNKLHLQKQTLKIKNVGLKHQLSLTRTEVQSVIIKCKELSRVKQNLYCLLEKTKMQKLAPSNIQSQNSKETMLKDEIARMKEQVKIKGEETKALAAEHSNYTEAYSSVMNNISAAAKKISDVEQELLQQSTQLKQIKQINFDLEKMKRILQEQKDTTIAFQAGNKINHDEFLKQYFDIIQRLKKDEQNIHKTIKSSQRKYALLILCSIFKQKQQKSYRLFWRVRGYILEGEASLKCIDNVTKIAQRVWKQNVRRMFSCWIKNVFDSRKIGQITESVISLNCDQKIKYKIFSKFDEGYNIEQLKLLKEYDKGKLLCQLKIKYLRKDAHVALTHWINQVEKFKEKIKGVKRINKIVQKTKKSIAIQIWRDLLVNKRLDIQRQSQSAEISKIKNMSYALNQIEQLKFDEQESKIRLFQQKHGLLTKIRSQHNYVQRMNRIFNVLNYQHEKNELRSAFYIYRSKCLKLKALETEAQFKVVKKEGQITKKVFKSTLTTKGKLRKNLLISFLGRYLSNKDLFYERRIGNLLLKWQRNLVNINATTKSAMRKTKLGIFTMLINHGIRKKYRISPQQIELLKNKRNELDLKQKKQIQNIQILQSQHQKINLLRVNQIMENRLFQNKLEIFKISTVMNLNAMRNKNITNLLEKVVKVAILRKGFAGLKIVNQDIQIQNLHMKKLSQYNFYKQRATQFKVLDTWKKYLETMKKIIKFLSKLSYFAERNNIRQGFKLVKNHMFTSSKIYHTKKIKQLEKQLTNQQISEATLEKQYLSTRIRTQDSMKKFFETFNSHMLKKAQQTRVESLQQYLNKWKQIAIDRSNDQNKVCKTLNKLCCVSVRKGFVKILASSINNIKQQYKQKIVAIRKKDKINELKIEKGQATFGEQLRKQRSINQTILKQLSSKERRFNKYMASHQEYYRYKHKRRLLEGVWKAWKHFGQIKKCLEIIVSVWDNNKKSKALRLIKQEAESNRTKCRKLQSAQKLIEFTSLLAIKGSYNIWRNQTIITNFSQLKRQSQEVTERITQKQQQNLELKQIQTNFAITTNIHRQTEKIFNQWKLQTKLQKIVNTKQQRLISIRKQLLLKQVLLQLSLPLDFSQKQNSLRNKLNQFGKSKQRKFISYFNSNIKVLKNAFKLISYKLSHAQIDNYNFGFARIQRAAAYKSLAFSYQQKKASLRLMSSLITQSNLNKQKSFYSFLSNEKVYHYLPNALYSIQKRLVQFSFYKLREVGYYSNDLIMKQTECIMEDQKYLINMEMRQMALEKINGKQLKDYLDNSVKNDLIKMKQTVCRLRLQGSKKKLIKCWNSWIEKVKLRKMAQNKLERIIQFSDCYSKYWSRWKRTKASSEKFPITLSRNELVTKHNQLQKLSVMYRKELFEMRGEITQLRYLNNTQQDKIATTKKIVLNRLNKCFKKGLSYVVASWKQRASKIVDRSKKYDDLTKHIQQLLSRRSALLHKISQVDASNSSLRENCKEGGVQVERLKDLLVEKENLSISLADKKHNIKILLQDNVKIKQKLKNAQDQAVKLVHEFQPLMDKTNLFR